MRDKPSEYAIYLSSFYDSANRLWKMRSNTEREHRAYILGSIDGLKDKQKDPEELEEAINKEKVK